MRHLIVLLCLSIPLFAHAAAPTQHAPEKLLKQASDKKLAQHPYWKKLLHYREAGGGVQSDIVSPEFFLSAAGANDPEQELTATLSAYFAPPGEQPDLHAQCRYVARYQWLRKMLDWAGSEPPQVECKRFLAWSSHGRVKSLSLVFATGYFSNPASFYGHLLLKLNAEGQTAGLLDQSLNFGAIVPDDELAIVYVSKGIFGGYEAAFSSMQFYRHNHSYAEEELRDLWEYELDLSQDEVERLIAHGWELLSARFDYYFAQQNCAYRMAELLNLVIDQPLRYESLPWSVPGTVFDHLAADSKEGRAWVRRVSLLPSRLNRFQTRYFALSAPGQRVLQQWVAAADGHFAADYAELPETEKVALVDALIEYTEYRRIADAKDGYAKWARPRLLLQRAQLPARTGANQTLPEQGAPPHEGPRPIMVRLGVAGNSQAGNGITVQLRPAYFDRLSIDAGRIANATLTMFDLQLVKLRDGLHLRRFDAVNLEHLNIARTPLPSDGGMAWRLRFGVETQSLACVDCLVGVVRGGVGQAWSMAAQVDGYVMADLWAQTPHLQSGTLGGAIDAGVVATLAEGWKSSLEVGRRTAFNGARNSAPVIKWQNRLGGNRDWDIRINYERDGASQWQLALSRYW